MASVCWVTVRAPTTTQIAHHCLGLASPVCVDLALVPVQEHHSAHVGPVHHIVYGGPIHMSCQQRVPQVIPRQDIGAPAQNQRRSPVEGTHQVPGLVAHLFWPRAPGPRCPPGCPGQPVEVFTFVRI